MISDPRNLFDIDLDHESLPISFPNTPPFPDTVSVSVQGRHIGVASESSLPEAASKLWSGRAIEASSTQ